MTIQSAKHDGTNSQDIIVDGEGLYQIFSIDSDCYVNIYGITFINGKSEYGGAIDSEGNLKIEDSIFKNNIATEYGGTICSDGEELNIYIKNSRFINNSALRENT
ncbi:hypothetical protein ALNOE001_14980 [Candidatus Methanobinarius endosymbioticus]|uniref:Right handed beta helix domain-containing protein n=1 Tax=Candidatus Methanobinarius endosymbioticus TaxID=2006182 RepID=A0A366M9E5_9EURY|nr:hypothetical protein ALNOE001_14980 [Candidatus Methanobinarius endosymbioticus]